MVIRFRILAALVVVVLSTNAIAQSDSPLVPDPNHYLIDSQNFIFDPVYLSYHNEYAAIYCSGDNSYNYGPLPCIFSGTSLSVNSPQPNPTAPGGWGPTGQGYGHSFIFIYPFSALGLVTSVSFDVSAPSLSTPGNYAYADYFIDRANGTRTDLNKFYLSSTFQHMTLNLPTNLNPGDQLAFAMLQYADSGQPVPNFTMSNIVLTKAPLNPFKIEISSVRIGQTVFDPDKLVTNKTFAIETTITGTIPESVKGRKAFVRASLNNQILGASTPFGVRAPERARLA